MTSTLSVLIIGRPGRMRQGLEAMLRAIPQIKIVGQADCESHALTLIAQQPPALVLLDSSLSSVEMQPTLAKIKSGYPQTRCIVLVKNLAQQAAAKKAGADSALITGFSATELYTALDRIRGVYYE